MSQAIQEQNESGVETNNRKRNLLVLALVVVICLAAYAAYWWSHARFFVSTDNAYVTGDIVQITSEVPGTVTTLSVDNTESVTLDQSLLSLDPADADIAVAEAKADLAHTVREVRGLFASSAGLEARIDSQRVELEGAKADLQRREKVAAAGGVSHEELQHSKDEVARLQASLQSTREDLAQVNAQIDNTTLDDHPDIDAAAARLRKAVLDRQRTEINAPVAGVVAQRRVEIGQRIEPGDPLMTVVPLSSVWVDANFKEVQLQQVRVGQPVTLEADLYGSRVEYHGHVAGLSAGTGSAFALLPAQNASGNWIKIVQRLPVRIALDPAELEQHPLRVGLSMNVKIDVHDTSGSMVATQVRPARQVDRHSAKDAREAEQMISNIIDASNGAAALVDNVDLSALVRP